ncbi:hypothetical protein BSK33_03425 [Geobacillus sp. 44B]|nr:hypothetical protein BSK33_03425 [Geobacillus sp. 44B]
MSSIVGSQLGFSISYIAEDRLFITKVATVEVIFMHKKNLQQIVASQGKRGRLLLYVQKAEELGSEAACIFIIAAIYRPLNKYVRKYYIKFTWR